MILGLTNLPDSMSHLILGLANVSDVGPTGPFRSGAGTQKRPHN